MESLRASVQGAGGATGLVVGGSVRRDGSSLFSGFVPYVPIAKAGAVSTAKPGDVRGPVDLGVAG